MAISIALEIYFILMKIPGIIWTTQTNHILLPSAVYYFHVIINTSISGFYAAKAICVIHDIRKVVAHTTPLK